MNIIKIILLIIFLTSQIKLIKLVYIWKEVQNLGWKMGMQTHLISITFWIRRSVSWKFKSIELLKFMEGWRIEVAIINCMWLMLLPHNKIG